MGQQLIGAIGLMGAFASVVAAGLWLSASQYEVPDNQDTFIAALKEIGRRNTLAARAQSVAALCAVVVLLWQVSP